jgi:hypothetical protein
MGCLLVGAYRWLLEMLRAELFHDGFQCLLESRLLDVELDVRTLRRDLVEVQ